MFEERKSVYVLSVVAAFLMVGAGVLLGYLQVNQRLSESPVKVVSEPMPGVDSSDPDKKVFTIGTNRIYLPERVLDYSSILIPVEKAEYDTLPKDTTYGRRLYRASDGFEIVNMVVLMGADRTSIHKPQYCLEGTGWRIDRSEQVLISMDKPFPYQLPVMRLTLSGYLVGQNGERSLKRGVFLYWFVAPDRITADHKNRMWSVAAHRILKGEVQRWAYVIYFSTCSPGEEDVVFDRMKVFIRESLPEYQLVPKVN